MKKVFTLTCTWAPSYGAVLQAYALVKHIRNNGSNAHVINYQPAWLKIQYRTTTFKKLLYPVFVFKNFVLNKGYNDFLGQEAALTDSIFHSSKELEDTHLNADAFMVGSDQVWNCTKYYNGKDDAMFLSFTKNGQKKISYAASLAMKDIPNEQATRYKSLLATFDAISVREKSGEDALKKIGVKDISVVIDPVYLLDKTQYDDLANKSRIDINGEQYLLVVCLEDRDFVYQYAKRRADQLGVKLYSISNGVSGFVKKHNEVDRKLWNKNVYDYLKLFSNAEEVVADSFHAMSFAIIFQKNIHVILRGDKGNSRMIDLLKDIGLSDRIVKKQKLLSKPIDYSKTNKIIAKKRDESIDFLKRALDIKVKEKK